MKDNDFLLKFFIKLLNSVYKKIHLNACILQCSKKSKDKGVWIILSGLKQNTHKSNQSVKVWNSTELNEH